MQMSQTNCSVSTSRFKNRLCLDTTKAYSRQKGVNRKWIGGGNKSRAGKINRNDIIVITKTFK